MMTCRSFLPLISFAVTVLLSHLSTSYSNEVLGNNTAGIEMYGLDPAPFDIVGYSEEGKAEACRSYSYQKFITGIKLLKEDFIQILDELKPPNLMDLTSLLRSTRYSSDESHSLEVLSQFIDTLDDVKRTETIFKCQKYSWCMGMERKAYLMEKAMTSIRARFKDFGEGYMPQTFVLYPGRIKCKAPFQWLNILQTLGAFLHCSSVCNTCAVHSKYNKCQFVPLLQMHPDTSDSDADGPEDTKKKYKPVEMELYDIPLPDDDKTTIPEPPDSDNNDGDNTNNKTKLNNGTSALEGESSFIVLNPPPPSNMLERVLSIIPDKVPDDYEITVPISVNLGKENGIEIPHILDFLTSLDNPTNFVFDVRWEDEKRSDYKGRDDHIKSTIHAGENSTGQNTENFHLASSGWMQAWKKINPWNGGLSQVSCPVTVKQGSKVAYTSCDLRSEISPGDHIKIRDQEFIIRPPMTDKHILLNSMVSGPSKSDLFVYKVSACFKLYGTVAVSKGSSIVTTTVDQRKVLQVGDVVEIGSEQFEVVALLDSTTFSISREWENINLVAADLYKCPSAVNYGEELPGRCNVVKGSRVVRTSSDMTNFISPSDIIKIGVGGDSYQLVEPEDATTLTLNRAYLGVTAEMRCFRMARSEKQRALEQLAQKKLMCQSLYCLAKIEEEERAIAFSLPRELTVLNSASWTGSDEKVKEFDNQMQRTKLVAGEEKPGYIPPDDEGANTGPDNLQKNAATSHISSAGVALGGRSNQDIDKENELAKKKNAKPLVPTSGKPPPRKRLRKTQVDKAIEGEEEEDGSKMEKPKDGEDPETSSAFKKFMAKQPKVPSIAEQKENEKAEEEARSPVSKSMDSKASKLLAGPMQ